MEKRKIEIMDTTLRDGEQTSGVLFCLEKLTIAQLLLEELNVDRIEICMCKRRRISGVKGIMVGRAPKDTKTASKF
jgi:D-citramalate synthase